MFADTGNDGMAQRAGQSAVRAALGNGKQIGRQGMCCGIPGECCRITLRRFQTQVRLTFKLEADQLWIGTKERTEKIGMQSVRAIVSEPIEGHEEYHIMGIQLGPTEVTAERHVGGMSVC